MYGWLKQSTAVTVKLGPFVDETDGKTAETGLTISQADVRLTKNGGDMAQKNNASSCTHDEIGYYDCPLSTTDTNTLGHLRLAVHESGALPVRADFMVVPANVWDSLFGADKLQVHVDEITAGLITNAAIANDAFTANKFHADVTTEFQNGLATAAALTVIDDFIDTEISAILAAVDTEIATIISTLAAGVTLADGAVTPGKITADALNSIADAVFKRDWSAITGEANRSLLNAGRFLRNKWWVDAGVLHVTKENDTTEAWTAVLSENAAANPVTGSDPA